MLRVGPDRQALLVPEHLIGQARDLGATWDREVKVWSVPAEDAGSIPRAMLPLRDRPGLKAPYMRIDLIPETSWGCNVRALMPKADWKAFARKHVYAVTGRVCIVCGGRGPQWPVEADEVWRFDDNTHVQTLHRILPLCPACHEVRTAGFATSQGRYENVARHLAFIDRIPVAQARRTIDKALKKWERRSMREWRIDYSHMQDRYGITLKHDQAAFDEANMSARLDSMRRHERR